MLAKDLKKLGFSKNLIKVYLTLIKLGEAKARRIIDETGFHRNIVYDKLDQLVDKNLVAVKEKSGVNVYQALDPSRLMQEVKRKEELTKNIIEEVNAIKEPRDQEITVREGKKELKNSLFEMYEEASEKDATWKVLGASNKWNHVLSSKDKERIIKQHNKGGFDKRFITDHISEYMKQYKQKTNGLSTFKVVPEVTSKANEVNIFDNRVVSTILVEPYTVIEIRNKEFIESYQKHFDLLWKQEVFTYRGWNEIEDLYMNKLLPSLEKHNATEYTTGGIYSNEGEEVVNKVVDLFLKYNKKRVKLGLDKKMLIYEKETDMYKRDIERYGGENLTELRILPNDYYSNMEIHIYPDYVALQVWDEEPVTTVYKKPKIIEGYRQQFQFLWDMTEDSKISV